MKEQSMKRFGLVMLSVLMLLLSVVLFACNKKDEKEVSSVTLEGLKDAYYITEEVDLSSVKLNVVYDDESTDTFDKFEVDLAENEQPKEGTEFILYTNGLISAGGLREGEYQISCLIVGESEPRTLKTVEVNEDMSLVYNLGEFSKPQFVQDYEDNLSVSEASGDVIDAEGYEETAFMSTGDVYAIGDDNEFIFKPKFNLISKATGTPVSADIAVNVSLKDEETDEVVGSEIYSFNEETYGFSFTGSAIGKTFTLTMTPTDWDLTELEMNPIEFTFSVNDGYNVYDALDLGRINLFNDTAERLQAIKANGYLGGTYSTSVRNIFFFGADAQTPYSNLNYYDLWEEFLTEKGEENLEEINGVYLHGNISVQMEDLPEEYFISQEELDYQGKDTDYALNSIRDFAFLYNHYLVDSEFVFNGNLFAVDFSDLKVGCSYANISGTFYIYDSETDVTGENGDVGHSAAFAFVGNENYPTATLKNVDVMGNMRCMPGSENDEADLDASAAAGALIMVKSLGGVTKVDNVIAKEFLIAFYMDGEEGLKTMEITDSKAFDCFNSAVFSWVSNNNTISNSHFERFGGPVIFLISRVYEAPNNEEIGSENPDESLEEKEPDLSPFQAGVTVDANSKLVSLVTGTEGWFAVNAATGTATDIKSMLNDAVMNYGATVLTEDKLNMVAVCMDTGYLGSDKTELNSKFVYGDTNFDTADKVLNDGSASVGQNAFAVDNGEKITVGPVPEALVQLLEQYGGMLGEIEVPKEIMIRQNADGTETVLLPASLGLDALVDMINTALKGTNDPTLTVASYDMATTGDHISVLSHIPSSAGTTKIGIVLGLADYVPAA